MQKSLRISVVLALAAACGVAALGDDAKSPTDARLDAIVAKAGTDAEAALAEATAVAEAEPENPRAWNVRGWIRLERGEFDEAEADFDRALAIDAGYAAALYNRGLSRVRRKDTDAAIGWFDRALAADPDHVRALVERGRLLRDDGRVDEARKDLVRATELAPKDVSTWQNLGWLEQKQSKWSDAVRDYRRALALRAEDAWTLGARAKCLAELGHFDEAMNDLEAAERAGSAFDLDTARRAEAVAGDLGLLPQRGLRLRRREAETFREIRFLAEVTIGATTRDAAGEATTSGMDDDDGAASRRARTKGLARLGLVRQTADVGAARAEARRAQIAGYYDSKSKQLFVVGGEDAPLERGTAVHELVHALQDQHFDLTAYRRRSLGRRPKGIADEDLEIATRMVPEGDAMYAQGRLEIRERNVKPAMERTMLRMAARMVTTQDPVQVARVSMRAAVAQSKLSQVEADRIEALEPYALISEIGPYLYGMGLVEALHSRGGWDEVAKLYADPPRTTEQCLHPDRYAAHRDEPTPLDFTGIAAPDGWTAADARVLGELNVLTLLRTQDMDWQRARPAGEGWDGDFLRTWTAADGRAAILWVSTWDTRDDAEEFLRAYEEIVPEKYEACGEMEEVAEGVPAPDAAAGAAPADPQRAFRGHRFECGEAEGAVGWTVVRGREVFVVEGFAADAARAVLDAALGVKIEHAE